jgi:cytochrome c nitrite reductase small subunit
LSLQEAAQQPEKSARRLKQIILGSLGAIVILVATATVTMHLTSQPSFCASCHQIQPQVAAWQKGPHNTVECLECHAEPGTLGYVERKIGGLNEVYLQATNQVPAKIEAKPHLASCIACHSGENSKYPSAKNIKLISGDKAPKFDHTPLLNNNLSCLSCHQNVGHGQKAVAPTAS